ncbi:antihemorrhagic factor cHLP-B-like isoform X2 [Vanacampus margaritifer]
MMATHLFAVLLWCAAALPGFVATQTVTCGEDSVKAAAGMAVRHINGRHKHGFKFRLQEVQSSSYQQFSGGCHIDVNVKLVQTKCHFSNPKPANECQLWRLDERGAVATCSVEFWVMWGVAKITKYECTTRPELTNEELLTTCPACPRLLPLDEPTVVKAAHYAVVKFNRESKHHNYFTLMEVAHVTIRHHVYCQTSYYNSHQQLGTLDCEMYPPKIAGPHPTGEPQAVCKPLFHQSPEACVCKDKLRKPEPSIHHICPFPLK